MPVLFTVGYTRDNCPFSLRRQGDLCSVVVHTPTGRVRIDDLDPYFDLSNCIASELVTAYKNSLN